MTNFWTVFKALFKEKSRSTYLVFGVQVLAVLIILIISAFNGTNLSDAQIIGAKVPSFVAVIDLFVVGLFTTTGIAAPVYLLMTSWKNEKINRSQTWRLMPISDSKFYTANTLSSLASYAYLGVLQVLVAIFASIITYLSSSEVRKEIALILKEMQEPQHALQINWFACLEMVVAAILIGLFWYIIVSFYHFVSRSVIDFLPATKNGFILLVIRVITLIVVVYTLYFVINTISNLGNPLFALMNGSDFSSGSVGAVVIFLAILDAIFGGINLWLFNKFVEAKQNR